MKSKITMNLRWVSWLIIGMGSLFLCIGGAVCFAAWKSGSVAPEEATLFYSLFLGTFGCCGIAMIVIGAIIGNRMSRKAKLKQQLLQDGTHVWADVMDISQNYNVRVNGRSPFVLRCKYRHSDGRTYIFTSQSLRFNPESFLRDNKVKVWFDRNDIKKYYVDVDDSMEGSFVEL